MIYTKETLEKIAKHLKMRFPVAEFSRDLGYSKGAVSNYMTGKKPVSTSFVRSIENHYKINADEFTDAGALLNLTNIKELSTFIAENQDELMKDPLFRTVIESLFLRKEIDSLRK